MLDLLITGGTVVDGTGSAGVRADVAVSGDRIVGVGASQAAEAGRVIDATGKLVVPGFVDPHSHTDWTVHTNPAADSTIRQGVTTEIVGNCGITNAPVTSASHELVAGRLRSFGYEGEIGWRTFGEYLDDLQSRGTSQSLAAFVGHSTLRAAGPHAMPDLLREAMESGALGMSTGLEYGHGRFARTPELVRLARILAEYDGIYASHIRNRDAALLEAVDEFFTIAEAAGGRGQISHLNVRYDTGVPPGGWQRAVDAMTARHAAGMDVQADMTPLTEGIGLMVALLPDWLLTDGFAAAADALREKSVRDRVRADCDRYWRFIHKGQWDRVRLESSPHFPDLGGLTFPEIADRLGQSEWDCYFDILAAAGAGMGELVMIGRLFTENHLADMARHPLFSLGVDSYSSSTTGPLASIVRNPLAYCGHTHYLTHFVRDQRILGLETAIRKMTSMPADRFGLTGRGWIATGNYADLAVLDLKGLADVSTFEDPVAYVRGVEAVVVNGRVTVDAGGHTGARAGRILRRSAAAPGS